MLLEKTTMTLVLKKLAFKLYITKNTKVIQRNT